MLGHPVRPAYSPQWQSDAGAIGAFPLTTHNPLGVSHHAWNPLGGRLGRMLKPTGAAPCSGALLPACPRPGIAPTTFTNTMIINGNGGRIRSLRMRLPNSNTQLNTGINFVV